MTKRSSTKHAAAAPKGPKTDTPRTEPLTETVVPAIGPNPEGLSHQAVLAHAPDDETRAKLARDFERRHADQKEG